ncbi:AmmeMemoRadiSam system radical SAM enzyme [bacterium]|nr:AmmeMemoRadiSam system radical SAM enzyme [bacterium]MBU1753188.1 AmmeMemoRadiSam system radical SAM enzyme [bacterium]
MKESRYYTPKENNRVACHLCPRECVINESKAGICRGRVNHGGKLYAQTYGECSSVAMDPIEKKPLYHFYPGSQILSIGTTGCNLKCQFCQNWHISQESVSTHQVSPEDIVKYAKKYNAIGVAYTYNEPFIWYEYVLDTAKMIKQEGLKNVLVTNGYVNEQPLLELLPYIDALNIDVKSIEDGFYQEICGGVRLNPVLNTIKLSKKNGCWVELTNLVIPTLNDSPLQINNLINWISEEIGDSVPLHFSRYFPNYKMNLPPTPLATLEQIYHQSLQRLKYVYIGNACEINGDNTCCPMCNRIVIKRKGYGISQYNLKDGRCGWCNSEINGQWEKYMETDK